ncbi:carbohydrate-binding protein [Planomonospora venezuelensis]|uniref:Protocatechuate 3,4-dioxygenase beta subunit n=1 Tax=Planomonospora venezuelensis TaxID=1999 RepID=A0A841DDT4_PLAVE|nr:carbohydrate-binding protein [Planomonospora venezuelensis]MBB5966255.1 protocatechuate 3,4-dioxygenase beta subunit [Planomonospora venezuelensis]GIM98438.1 dioxygenase [Planomonospora venezuelensis]
MSENPHATDEESGLSRKQFIAAVGVGALAVPAVVGAATAGAAASGAPAVDEPLACTPGRTTIAQTEGPYFKPNSPERDDLTAGVSGTRLVVTGHVFNRACQPLSRVLLDFWQADTMGAYDNVRYTLRGHLYTDANGVYRLTTIVPGLYPGRTRHIHVKLQAPGRPQILTTQLYFPGEPRNNTDTIYDPSLLMNVRTVGSGREATFDFVLDVAGTSSPTPTPTPTVTPTGGGGTWRAGTAYSVGDQVTYGGAGYRCLQAHTALAGWEPPNVPALWRRL